MTAAAVEHRYRPRGSAARLLRERVAEVLVSGSAGTGKSRACLEKLNLLALLNPGMRGLIVRKTLASLASTALDTWRKKVVTELLDSKEVWFYGGSAEEPPQYQYRNGSTIVIGGLDKPSRIMSSEYDVIYVQEATELTETDWQSLTTRLRNWRISFQQLIADCNPSYPTHWLKQRCDAGVTLMLESRHEENPILFDDTGQITERGAAYMAKLDALTGVRYHRLRRGLWVGAEGIVYEGFDPAVHVIDRFEIPWEWTRYWVIDFGFRNPFVLQWWAENPDGRLFMYREIYHTERIVEDHAKQAIALVTDADGIWVEPKPAAVICDHDAEDRATWQRHSGLATRAAKKGVSDGIQATQARFRPAWNGKPGVAYLRDGLVERDASLVEAMKPSCTVEEIPGYVWAPGPDGKPARENPVKENDHGADCTRYMVADRDLRARVNVRFM